MSKIYITGIAGFIGFHLQKILKQTYHVEGIDILNNKASIHRSKYINFEKNSILDTNFSLKNYNKPDIVVHLAAETGIPNSITNPSSYINTNVNGTFSVLEQCRKNKIKYFIYASSSSVYEENQHIMSENSSVNNQLSFYGTTKRMTEVMIENYCKQFGIIAIGLRFFTVYGSWTRPDMAAYKFMNAINNGNSITLYNNGKVDRDFTHVSDIVNTIELLIKKIVIEKPKFHQIFNIGNGNPISVKKYATLIAKELDKPLVYKDKPLPKNELTSTYANTNKLFDYINFKPKTRPEKGVKEMVDWFKKHNYE